MLSVGAVGVMYVEYTKGMLRAVSVRKNAPRKPMSVAAYTHKQAL